MQFDMASTSSEHMIRWSEASIFNVNETREAKKYVRSVYPSHNVPENDTQEANESESRWIAIHTVSVNETEKSFFCWFKDWEFVLTRVVVHPMEDIELPADTL